MRVAPKIILTPAQRDFVESRMKNRGARANATGKSRRLDRANGDEQAHPRSRAQRPKRLDGETSEQFQQRMLERIEQLPEEQQERALQRLNRAIQRMSQQDAATGDKSI